MLDTVVSRHPQDVELLTRLLEGVSFEDKNEVKAVAKSFQTQRTAHASTINVLANALYQVRYNREISHIAACMTVCPVGYKIDSELTHVLVMGVISWDSVRKETRYTSKSPVDERILPVTIFRRRFQR